MSLPTKAMKFSGPIACHAAACALRNGTEGAYLLARSMLVTLYALLASQHDAITPEHRFQIRSVLTPAASNLLSQLADLRTALRCMSGQAGVLPFAQAARVLAGPLYQMSRPVSAASFALYSFFVSVRSPVLFMRALSVAKELRHKKLQLHFFKKKYIYIINRFSALACLSAHSASVASDCAALFFRGVCVLNLFPIERVREAASLFRSALQSARNENRCDYVAMISGPSSLSSPISSYLLNVVSLLETLQKHDPMVLSRLVVEMSQFALSIVPPSDAHVFVSKSFRHNLRLNRHADA